MATLQKIAPHLWFDTQAEEAVKFYASVFKDAEVGHIARYGKEGFEIHGMPEGTVMTIDFKLMGMQFVALNGGPHFKFNEAVSFMILCDTQEEIDYYWEKLGKGGDPRAQQCGWLKDQFGLSWQVAPRVMGDLLAKDNKEANGRMMNSMLQMKKINLAEIMEAYNGN